MFPTAGRVFTGLTRVAFSRGIFIDNSTPTVRPNIVRPLTLSFQRSARSTDDDKEVNNEPIKFSTSKASHRTWKVDHSMGSQFEQPLWKVLPISLFAMGFLLWCALRSETDIDAQLEKELYDHLPGLLSDLEEEEQNK